MDLSVFAGTGPIEEKTPKILPQSEKSNSYKRVSETLLSFLPKSSRNNKTKKKSTIHKEVSPQPHQILSSTDLLVDPNRKRKKSRRSTENLNPAGGSNSVHWVLPEYMYSKTNKEKDNFKTDISERSENASEQKENKLKSITKKDKNSHGLGKYSVRKHKKSNFDKTKNISTKVKMMKMDDHTNSIEKYRLELEKLNEIYEIKLEKNKEKFSKQISKLRQENDRCIMEISRLEELVEHWKAMSEQEENQTVISSKLKFCMKENKNFKEDFEVLKSVIRRLNKEISFYQEKLRQQYSDHPNQIPIFSSSSADSNLTSTTDFDSKTEFDEPKKNLLPLLKAYDEVIEEKQDIIKENEFKMEKFKLKCQEIVQENDMLHKIIGENKVKGCVSIEEWQFLYDNAILVLEENDILYDKISVLQKKSNLIQNTHDGKVSKLKMKLSLLEDDKTRLLATTTDMEKQCTAFTDQIKKMAVIIQQRIPVEEHEASVRECKQLFEDLKRRYGEERIVLTEKLNALETEKERLVIELTDSDAENAKLQANLNNLETSITANDVQMRELQIKLTEAAKSRDMTSDTINEMMELVKTIFAEREAIEASLNEQKTLNQQMMSLRTRESELVSELQNKIEVMAEVHKEEIHEHLNRINKLEEVLQTIGDRHQIDVLQLKELVDEKTNHIYRLQTEKRQLIEDLETVWRATAKDRGELIPISFHKINHGVHN